MTPPEDPQGGDRTDDWGALGTTWRSTPRPDMAALLHEVHTRRRHMIAAVVAELALSSLATVAAVRRVLHPTPVFTPGMAVAAVVAIWMFQALLLYLRRRHWRRPPCNRAICSIRSRGEPEPPSSSWLNAAGMAGRYLALSPIVLRAWRAGMPRARLMTLVAVHATIVAAATVFSWWYLRRQRRHLRQVSEMRTELGQEVDQAAPGSP
jgi:hypothetical protein